MTFVQANSLKGTFLQNENVLFYVQVNRLPIPTG